MPDLVDVLTYPGGAPVRGADVTMRVRTPGAIPGEGALAFDPVLSTSLAFRGQATTQDDGSYAFIGLTGSNDLNPPGSVYELTFTKGDATWGPYLFSMPSTGGPYLLGSLITTASPPGVPSVAYGVPHLYAESTGTGLVEVNYGTSPAAREYEAILDGPKCTLTAMIRMGTGYSMGAANKAVVLGLPYPCRSLGNGIARMLGWCQHGMDAPAFKHVMSSVHSGHPGDPYNLNYAYFVPQNLIQADINVYLLTDRMGSATTIKLADGTTQAFTGWHDWHIHLEYAWG